MDCPTWDGIILALAAVVAATLAAGTAIWRQRKQLDAESRRQQKQLNAESERLDRQLGHDRWTREVEELRSLVDDAATAGLAAGNLIHVFRGQVRWMVEDEGQLNAKYTAKLRAAEDAVAGMQGFVERFELRLGVKHPIPDAFAGWQLAQEQALESFSVAPPTKESVRQGSQNFKLAANRYVEFMDSARPFVQLDPPPPP
jgi:hypothetical protein